MQDKKPRWTLERVNPLMGGLTKVLPVWFKHSKLLKALYVKHREKHKDSASGGKSRRDNYCTLGLLSIRSCIYSSILGGFTKTFGAENEELSRSPLRWIMNCRPSGGKWVGPARSWYCRNLFCPWCWMRRHDLLYRGLKAKPGEKVSYAGRSMLGLGMSGRLHCLSFRLWNNHFYSSFVPLHGLLGLATAEIAPFRGKQTLLRVCYPMPDLKGATVAYFSDKPFKDMTSGTEEIPALESGRLGIHVTEKPLPFSRLLASRMRWVPEMLAEPREAERVLEIFRGKNLFTTSLERRGS